MFRNSGISINIYVNDVNLFRSITSSDEICRSWFLIQEILTDYFYCIRDIFDVLFG